MTPTTALAVVGDDARSTALLKAVGFDKLSEPQRELALAIAGRYDLDVMLKHLVMIEGRPYITRDGLLHVAHKSGAFDGMETTEPTLDADGAFWRATCSVYRKDMSRPFTYTGRYPAKSGNVKYAPEMAIKVGEVMALRRAFDVAAPVIEERWAGDHDDEPIDDAPVPTSLAERVALAAAAVVEPEPAQAADLAVLDHAETPEPTETPEPVEPDQDEPETPEIAAAAAAEYDAALQDFVAWAKASSVAQADIKRLARDLFPDARGFRELAPADLARLRTALEAIPTTADNAPFVAPPTPGAGAQPLVLCGAPSPLSDSTCTLDRGHPGRTHRAGVRESWEEPA